MNQEQQSLPQESIEQMFAAFGLETEAQRQIVLSQGVAFTAPEPQLVIETRLSTNAGSDGFMATIHREGLSSLALGCS